MDRQDKQQQEQQHWNNDADEDHGTPDQSVIPPYFSGIHNPGVAPLSPISLIICHADLLLLLLAVVVILRGNLWRLLHGNQRGRHDAWIESLA